MALQAAHWTNCPGSIYCGITGLLEVVNGVQDIWGLNKALSKGLTSTAGTPSTQLPSNSDPEGLTLKREVKFSEIILLALLAMHTFYRMGHQPTIPSLQWKTAFVLVSSIRIPYSQITVILNTLGPIS
ncbi:hypothetical protein BKA83DRAFT_4130751 [Pisolithus microcarpus]|nr:hypothetical protein BKA83DRAFT_4130751 [Pisolithus microcarpus]